MNLSRLSLPFTVAALLLTGPALAGPKLFDTFEGGMGNWVKWPEATETLQADDAHVRSPTTSAKQVEGDPQSYASYHDFGAEAGSVYAEVYVWDDVHDDGTDPDRPVSNGLALIAGNQVGEDGWNYTDYLQLGVIPWGPAGSVGYSIRTKYNDDHALGYIDTGVTRKVGWTKLAIWADSVASGGEARFYIDGLLVGTSARSGVDLQYVRIGFTNKSLDNFWYDDVLIDDEPPVFYDDFESGMGNWSGWQDVTVPPGCCGPYMLFIDPDHSHVHNGLDATRQEAIQPWWYGSVHDEPGLSADTDKVLQLTGWQFEAYDKQVPFLPGQGGYHDHDQVQGWIALMNEDESEFFALGIHAHWASPEPVLNWWGNLAWATAADGWQVTTFPRGEDRWQHLKIMVKPYTGNVGDVEFYVGLESGGEVAYTLVGSGRRLPGDDCRGVAVTRIGIGASPAHVDEDYISNTYEFFWYDEIALTREEGTSLSPCPNADLRFDADNDDDVDQADFAAFQTCFTGDGDPGGTYDHCSICRCMNANGAHDSDVDEDDWAAFEDCASGPGILAQEDCDDALDPP